MRIGKHAASLALVLVTTSALAGCGSGGGSADSGPSASRSGSPSATVSGTPSPSGSPSASTTGAPTPPWQDAAPAKGKRFSGSGFSFRAPKGWTDATTRAKQLNKLVDLAAAAAPDDTGFATNVNVVVSDAGVETPTADQLQQISDAIGKRLKGLVPHLEVNPRTTIDNRPALDHEGAATKSGVDYYIHQFVAFDHGSAYTITFSFSRQAKPKERARTIASILATWSWR